MSLNTNFVNAAFKKLHKDAIDSLLENTALTVPCLLKYGRTKFEDCPNCLWDNIGGKSSNRYQTGGPIPFTHGICPYCDGAGRLSSEETEEIYLMPIWSSKDWYPISQTSVNMADIAAQTMSKIDAYEKIIRAQSIIIDTSLPFQQEFIRLGRPEILGLGDSTHILTSWKIIQ